MKRINVIGTSGSGKSTFSKKLADELGYPYIQMDQLYWKPNWQGTPYEELVTKLMDHITQDFWVLDGNYTRTIPVKWQYVDTIVWIDFSFVRTLFQAVGRAINRNVSGKELWPNTGNVETWRKFFSSDSVLMWTIKTYRKNRAQYLKAMNDPAYTHIKFIRIRNSREWN